MAEKFSFANLRRAVAGISNQVGSFFPRRDNFRLTPVVKEKFTEKLRSDPRDFCGREVRRVVRTGGLEVDLQRRVVGLLSIFRDQTGGARLFGGAQ
jgi:hypothetical protein